MIRHSKLIILKVAGELFSCSVC